MHANRSADADNDKVVVPLARGVESTRGSISEKLRLLVDLITHKNTQTDARLESLETSSRKQGEGYKDLASRTILLEPSANELKARSVSAESRLDIEEARSRSLGESTTALQEKSLSLESSLTHLEERTASGEARLLALEPKVNGLKGATEELGLRQHETSLRTGELEHKAGELENTDKRHALRTDGLENRLKWVSHLAGHSIFIVAVIAGVSYWHASKNLDAAALAINENISGKEAQLSAQFDKQVAAVYSTTSQRIEEKTADIDTRISDIDSRMSNMDVKIFGQLDQGLTALDSRLSGQAAAAESERTSLLTLSQEAHEKIAQLQQQFGESSMNAAELQSAHRSLKQSLQGITEHLLLVDAHFKAELTATNERIHAKDEDTRGVPVDISTLNDESWLKTRNPEEYSIQLVGAYRKSDLAGFIHRHRAALPFEELSYFKRARNGRDWYILLYGNYQGFQTALNSLEALPASLQINSPYIRSIGSVQESISRSSSS